MKVRCQLAMLAMWQVQLIGYLVYPAKDLVGADVPGIEFPVARQPLEG